MKKLLLFTSGQIIIIAVMLCYEPKGLQLAFVIGCLIIQTFFILGQVSNVYAKLYQGTLPSIDYMVGEYVLSSAWIGSVPSNTWGQVTTIIDPYVAYEVKFNMPNGEYLHVEVTNNQLI